MRFHLLFLVIMTTVASLSAQQKITVSGNVFDRVTTKDLPRVKLTVLNPDSTVAVETEALYETYKFEGNSIKEFETGYFKFDIPKASSPYIMQFSKEGYDTYEQSLDLSKMTSRQFELKLPPVYMTPVAEGPTVELDEVVVKTSKIKFYHKGDTIVYNADAFMLPQGSTLDALIAKLPGVEIKDGGKIYVNGKYVESLLLNGKDFFKGNQDILRQNLGAYAVKDVAVYDKYGQMSKLMGTDLEDDKEFVMDVRLKKDYMGGFLGNIEASYGTDDRYSGRLFGMHFNNNARFSLYGNVNNVNNTSRPNDGEGYNVYTERYDGISDIANGGFDYNVEDPRKVWSISGNVDAKYVKNTVHKNIFTESFLQRNSFQTTLDNMRNKNFSISTNHQFKLDKEFYYFNIRPEFRYNRTRSTSDNSSVEFDTDVQERYEINKAVIDAIYKGSQHELREALINRNRYNRKNRSNNYRGYFWSEQTMRFPGSPDALSVWIEGEYSRDHTNTLTDQNIDYGFNGLDAPVSSMAQRRESRSYPAYTAWMKGAARYFVKARKTQFTLGYEYRHEQQRKSSLEFLFDSHTQDEEAILPYDTELIPDLPNTNSSKLYANIHMLKGSFDYNNEFPSKLKFTLSVIPEFHIRRRNLFYHAFEMEDAALYPVVIPVSRTSCSFNNTIVRWRLNTPDYKYSLYMQYDFNTNYAPLTDMIDIPNTSDPLNIYHGNPNLKDAFTQRVNLNFSSQLAKNTNLNVYSSFHYNSRDIVKGYIYNSKTGVRDFQSRNVSGILYTSNDIYFYKSMTFGNHELSLNIGGNYGFQRYANMIGEDGPMKKQIVYSNSFGYVARIEYTLLGKYSLGGRFNASNTLSRTNTNDHTVERRLMPQAWINLKLPFRFSFNSTMNYLIYKGIESKGMNPNQCLLNANLRYQLNDNWSFRVEAYDILNQQKPYSNVVSAISRTQTIVNTLPRYFLLSVAYKFNTRKK